MEQGDGIAAAAYRNAHAWGRFGNKRPEKNHDFFKNFVWMHYDSDKNTGIYVKYRCKFFCVHPAYCPLTRFHIGKIIDTDANFFRKIFLRYTLRFPIIARTVASP